MYWVKEHKGVLAVCDKELINLTFEEGKRFIEIREKFYKGELVTKKRLKELLFWYNNINIVGAKSVKVAEEMKIVACKHEICCVPYAIILKM